jgi:hypothetical protein
METEAELIERLAKLKLEINRAKATRKHPEKYEELVAEWRRQLSSFEVLGEQAGDMLPFQLGQAINSLNAELERSGEFLQNNHCDDELKQVFDEVEDTYSELELLKDPKSTRSLITILFNHHRFRSFTYDQEERNRIKAHLREQIMQMRWEIRTISVAAAERERERLEAQRLQKEKEEAEWNAPPPKLTRLESVQEAFRQTQVPATQLWRTVNGGLDWRDDKRDERKAYICACISELVYLQMSKVELRGKDRYRVIPSLMLKEILERDVNIEITSVLGGLDIPVTVVDTGSFVFGTF